MKGQKFDLQAMLQEVRQELPAKTENKQAEINQNEINRLINERSPQKRPPRQ